MNVALVTLFPELFEVFLRTSFVGRARERGLARVHLEPLRQHGVGRHLSVDDTPYGGGSGMVLRVDCVVAAMEAADASLGTRSHRVLLTPQGRRLDQETLRALATRSSITLVCGRYEGFDERVRHFVEEEVSLGDFVLTGGEVAAMAIVEGVFRLLPGVLGNPESLLEESFSNPWGGLEYPQYTRPADFRGLAVPDVLASGDHERVAKFRSEAAARRTAARRPDLIHRAGEESEE